MRGSEGDMSVTDDEYREFLTSLFERYVRPRLPRLRRRISHHMGEEWSYHLDEAEDAGHVLRYIENYCDDDGDVYQTFRLERVARAVYRTAIALSSAIERLRKAGFLTPTRSTRKRYLPACNHNICQRPTDRSFETWAARVLKWRFRSSSTARKPLGPPSCALPKRLPLDNSYAMPSSAWRRPSRTSAEVRNLKKINRRVSGPRDRAVGSRALARLGRAQRCLLRTLL